MNQNPPSIGQKAHVGAVKVFRPTDRRVNKSLHRQKDHYVRLNNDYVDLSNHCGDFKKNAYGSKDLIHQAPLIKNDQTPTPTAKLQRPRDPK